MTCPSSVLTCPTSVVPPRLRGVARPPQVIPALCRQPSYVDWMCASSTRSISSSECSDGELAVFAASLPHALSAAPAMLLDAIYQRLTHHYPSLHNTALTPSGSKQDTPATTVTTPPSLYSCLLTSSFHYCLTLGADSFPALESMPILFNPLLFVWSARTRAPILPDLRQSAFGVEPAIFRTRALNSHVCTPSRWHAGEFEPGNVCCPP
jgi:hypothetical protein